MFIAHFKDGSTFTEKEGLWDDLPDKGITSLHITLPVQAKTISPDGTVKDLPSPTVELSNYDKYYFAHEAVANIFTIGSGEIKDVHDGQGRDIAEVMAGIDEKHNFVMYVRIDKKSNVTIKRFPVEKFKVVPTALRKGIW